MLELTIDFLAYEESDIIEFNPEKNQWEFNNKTYSTLEEFYNEKYEEDDDIEIYQHIKYLMSEKENKFILKEIVNNNNTGKNLLGSCLEKILDDFKDYIASGYEFEGLYTLYKKEGWTIWGEEGEPLFKSMIYDPDLEEDDEYEDDEYEDDYWDGYPSKEAFWECNGI